MAIDRSAGTTRTERRLARIAEHSLLNLWSYPNPYIDRGLSSNGGGQELCDLLVVCGDHVLIFSDKEVAWPRVDLGVAWPRWAKKAIFRSADQVRGAIRWIEQHPDRIFLDVRCEATLPISLPPKERRRVHGIVVANGATEACREHFGSQGTGSFVLNNRVVADASSAGPFGEPQPFTIGDINPGGPFIHVLTDVTLEILLGELDTITDFTRYLAKKEAFFRGQRAIVAAGEEELLAYYVRTINSDGDHDFVFESNGDREADFIWIDEGFCEGLVSNPQYIEKKKQDEVSYVWDRLIRAFTDNIVAGTLENVAGTVRDPDGAGTVGYSELGVRHMALQDRLARRGHGAAIMGALERGATGDRSCRSIVQRPGTLGCETGFFFMTLKVPAALQGEAGYAKYRATRSNMLFAYAMGLFRKFEHLQRMVGIATEPFGRGAGSSEDMLYMERPERTENWLREVDQICEQFGVMQPQNRQREVAIHLDEWPEPAARVASSERLGKRARRRAAGKARARGR
jgi:hypothetical protein